MITKKFVAVFKLICILCIEGLNDPKINYFLGGYPMTKRYSKLNFKTLLLVLIAIVMAAGLISCAERNQLPIGDLSVIDAPTGPLDESGNVITNTVFVTNVITVTNELKIDITNWVTNVIKVTNVVPDTEYHQSTKYKVYAPFSGIGREGDYKYTNVSYLDTKTLSELWKNVIKMKSHAGQELTLRNRQTGTYFYFDDNMDLRWSKKPNEVIKKFVQGLIIQHKCGNDTKGAYAIAGLYQINRETSELRKWNDTGVNIVQGELFSVYNAYERVIGEFDIIVLNPGHIINGNEYGFEIYNSIYNYAYGTNPYYEQKPEYYMSKITHVTEAWKNYKPNELHDITFQIRKR